MPVRMALSIYGKSCLKKLLAMPCILTSVAVLKHLAPSKILFFNDTRSDRIRVRNTGPDCVSWVLFRIYRKSHSEPRLATVICNSIVVQISNYFDHPTKILIRAHTFHLLSIIGCFSQRCPTFFEMICWKNPSLQA